MICACPCAGLRSCTAGQADLALTSGVHTGEDVIKAMMAGARVAMLASELLQKGLGRIPDHHWQNWSTG